MPRPDRAPVLPRLVAALARGPLTRKQIERQLALGQGGSKRALDTLLAAGQIVSEPAEEFEARVQYRLRADKGAQ